MSALAPIALFVFNRPDHTRRTLAALAANLGAADRELYIFSDGPRSEAEAARVQEVRALCQRPTGFSRVHLKPQAKNIGLAASIISGVTEVLSKHETVIVLEDDLLTSPAFLSYMDQGLARYERDERVASIHGYCYPVRGLPEAFFLRGADCWGWATWRRAWAVFRADADSLLRELRSRKLGWEFDFDGTYPYQRMLADNARGKNNSWAIRWHASAFLQGMLTLYPGKSLVNNIGLDGSGTHSGEDDRWKVELAASAPVSWPERVEESGAARARIRRYFFGQAPAIKKAVLVLKRLCYRWK